MYTLIRNLKKFFKNIITWFFWYTIQTSIYHANALIYCVKNKKKERKFFVKKEKKKGFIIFEISRLILGQCHLKNHVFRFLPTNVEISITFGFLKSDKIGKMLANYPKVHQKYFE